MNHWFSTVSLMCVMATLVINWSYLLSNNFQEKQVIKHHFGDCTIQSSKVKQTTSLSYSTAKTSTFSSKTIFSLVSGTRCQSPDC